MTGCFRDGGMMRHFVSDADDVTIHLSIPWFIISF